MESLYRKYRPQTFDDVVGQQTVVSTLERGIESGGLGHAYLFCGPRGTGKTTLARILAKALACDQGAGHLPDGTCEQCVAIAEGRHPDVHELDAASRTGVDAIREEIVNRVDFAPTVARQKVYIVDEVHMLTTAAFNALLKTLEEPPAHVVFVLCTTDPQKIPATILSRVQRFDFRSINDEDIRARLEQVCAAEGFSAEPEAIDIVARHARGGMRDALSTLEQLSVFGNGSITVADARDLLGVADTAALDRAVEALATRDAAGLFGLVADQLAAGGDLLRFCDGLTGRLRDVYVALVAGPVESLLGGSEKERTALVEQGRAMGSAERISRCLEVLGSAALDMRTARNPRLVLEVAISRLVRPESDMTVEALAERVAALEKALAAGGTAPAALRAAANAAPAPAAGCQPPAKSAAAASRPAAPAPSAPAAAPAQPAAVSRSAAAAPAAAPAPAASAPALAAPPVPRPAAPAAASQRPADPALAAAWDSVLATLRQTSAPTHALLMNARPVSDDGTTLVIESPQDSFIRGLLSRPDVAQAISQALSSAMGRRTLEVQAAGPSAPAPQASAAASRPASAPQSAAAPRSATPPQSAVPRPSMPSSRAPKPAPGPQPAAVAPGAAVPPWGEAAPASTVAPAPAPDDDWVPLEAYGMAPAAGPADAPAAPVSPSQESPAPAPRPRPASQPVAAPAPQPQPAPAPRPATVVAPQSRSSAPSDPFAEAAAHAAAQPQPLDPTGLTPDQASAFELVSSVFGEGVKVLPLDGDNPFAPESG